MNDILQGGLVRLSAMDADEAGKAFSRWSRDSEFIRFFNSNAARMASVKQEKQWIEKELEEQSVNQYWFSIHKLDDDVLLGETDLYVHNWSARDAFVAIGIGERDFWDKGYGTDAMNVILRYAFTEINMKRVSLGVFEYNPRAIRSYEKTGFHHEGRIRGLLNKEGKRWDMLSMSILREEWMEQHDNKTKS
jgi:RimJ/RimL family protein N-acetyltransferase